MVSTTENNYKSLFFYALPLFSVMLSVVETSRGSVVVVRHYFNPRGVKHKQQARTLPRGRRKNAVKQKDIKKSYKVVKKTHSIFSRGIVKCDCKREKPTKNNRRQKRTISQGGKLNET